MMKAAPQKRKKQIVAAQNSNLTIAPHLRFAPRAITVFAILDLKGSTT